MSAFLKTSAQCYRVLRRMSAAEKRNLAQELRGWADKAEADAQRDDELAEFGRRMTRELEMRQRQWN